MIIASERFQAAMTAPIAELFVRIELLARDESVLDVVTTKAISGSITVDGSRAVQRSFTLALNNANNEFTWAVGGYVWLDKRVRIYVSFDNVEWVSLGVFVLDEPSATSSHDGTAVAELSGGDKWRLLDGSPVGKLTNTLTIDAGLPVADAIKLVAGQGGVTRYLFDACDKTVPYTLNYDHGTARGEVIRELADFANFAVYFDVNGYLRFRPRPDYETAPTVATFDAYDRNTPYAGARKVLDVGDTFNKVLVIAGNNRVGPVSAVAVNTDPANPISTANIGERLHVWRGNSAHLITTAQEAQDRADYELARLSKVGEVAELSLLPNYLLEVDDIIRVVDGNIGADARFVVERISVPLAVGEYMQVTARRVVDVA